MRTIWILFKREMMAYFLSPIAYIVGVCFLVTIGIGFYIVVKFLSEGPGNYTPMMWFFNGIFTWIVLLMVPPVITMRLFADEKRTGTIESLMTTPVRDTEYVLAKFLSGYVFFISLWIPTFNYIFVLRHLAGDTTPLDSGAIIGGYLGLFLIGMLFTAIGCMASASTRNQIIAAVIAFAICCALFFVGILAFDRAPEKIRSFLECLSFVEHMREMSRGLVEWKRVVFYLSGTAFCLFVTHRMVQSRQWKN